MERYCTNEGGIGYFRSFVILSDEIWDLELKTEVKIYHLFCLMQRDLKKYLNQTYPQGKRALTYGGLISLLSEIVSNYHTMHFARNLQDFLVHSDIKPENIMINSNA